MGSWLDLTTKKTLLIIASPNGKYKVAGMYKITPLDGETLLVTFPNEISGPCGIEFDDIEYIDSYSNYHDPKAGQDELSLLEYKES